MRHAELVRVANGRGYEATSNRDRGSLEKLDHNLYPLVLEGDWCFVTNNEADFKDLAELEGLHAGLIITPPALRATQCQRFKEILTYIESEAAPLINEDKSTDRVGPFQASALGPGQVAVLGSLEKRLDLLASGVEVEILARSHPGYADASSRGPPAGEGSVSPSVFPSVSPSGGRSFPG